MEGVASGLVLQPLEGRRGVEAGHVDPDAGGEAEDAQARVAQRDRRRQLDLHGHEHAEHGRRPGVVGDLRRALDLEGGRGPDADRRSDADVEEPGEAVGQDLDVALAAEGARHLDAGPKRGQGGSSAASRRRRTRARSMVTTPSSAPTPTSTSRNVGLSLLTLAPKTCILRAGRGRDDGPVGDVERVPLGRIEHRAGFERPPAAVAELEPDGPVAGGDRLVEVDPHRAGVEAHRGFEVENPT